MAFGTNGQPCWVEGRVTDTDGNPIAGTRIEVWEADDEGFYDVQYGDGRMAARAFLFSEDDGSYRFRDIKPTPYPIPTTGRSAQCCRPAAGHRRAPRTCTPWSRPRPSARS